ncbi:MAG: hypothetical protein SFZ23_02270 [Planctomycetota bacterium]|nr:hypothetical protein [Planctomycetota bacterium]
MVEPMSEQGRKVAQAAQRLKLAYYDLADANPSLRAEQLREQVLQMAPKSMELSTFVAMLEEWFPVWSSGGAGSGASPAGPGAQGAGDGLPSGSKAPRPESANAAVPAPARVESDPRLVAELAQSKADLATAQADMADPWKLVELLRSASKKLDAGARERLADALAQAGIVREVAMAGGPSAPAASAPEGEREIKAKFQLAANQPVSPARRDELMVELADFVSKLEKFVWPAWSKIAPQSPIRPTTAVLATLGRYLVDEPPAAGATPEAIKKRIDERKAQSLKPLNDLKNQTLAMVFAQTRAGAKYAGRYVAKFAPDTIKGMIKTGLMSNRDAACWQRYVTMFNEYGENVIVAEINAAVSDDVEATRAAEGTKFGTGGGIKPPGA